MFFGRHLIAQIGAELLAPPAVAQRDGDRALGVGLADDMVVERRDDGFRRERVFHSISLWGMHVMPDIGSRAPDFNSGSRRTAGGAIR